MGWDSEREGVKKNLRRTKKEKPRKDRKESGWVDAREKGIDEVRRKRESKGREHRSERVKVIENRKRHSNGIPQIQPATGKVDRISVRTDQLTSRNECF